MDKMLENIKKFLIDNYDYHIAKCQNMIKDVDLEIEEYIGLECNNFEILKSLLSNEDLLTYGLTKKDFNNKNKLSELKKHFGHSYIEIDKLKNDSKYIVQAKGYVGSILFKKINSFLYKGKDK